MLLRCERLEPPMSQLGQIGRGGMSALVRSSPTSDIDWRGRHGRKVQTQTSRTGWVPATSRGNYVTPLRYLSHGSRLSVREDCQ